jgi:hypothetical protein
MKRKEERHFQSHQDLHIKPLVSSFDPPGDEYQFDET